MSYFFAPASRVEHLAQIAYYEAQHKGLGARYLAAFKQEMVQICAFPGRYKVVLPPDIRGHGIQGFPLDILYRSRATPSRF